MKNPYLVFLWSWCNHCKVAVILCPKCGNNCCNGSAGNSDGTNGGDNPDYACPFCNLAYQYQGTCCENDIYPKNKRQIASFNKKILENHKH